MSNRLSNSAANLFMECQTKYKLHYKDKLRGNTTNAALLFGSALDKAITSLLDESGYDPYKIFMQFWTDADINGVKTYIPTSPLVVYAESDFDEELLDSKAWSKLQHYCDPKNAHEEIERIYKTKKELGFDNLSTEDKTFLNLANWYCLAAKGYYMIECFKKNILPNIEKVLGLQMQIDLNNDSGDTVIGFADAVVKYKGYDKPIVFDLKTATREYEANAVLTSPQLTLYLHDLSAKFEDTRLAGFWVLHKTIRKNRKKVCSACLKDGTGQRHKTCDAEHDGKRCNAAWVETIEPEATCQILINEIPEYTENLVLENYDMINQSINAGHFYKNLGNCVKPYGKCQFYNLCHTGKDNSLIVVEDRRKS